MLTAGQHLTLFLYLLTCLLTCMYGVWQTLRMYTRPVSRTRGDDYKLYKSHTIGTRSSFFSERVINAWNGLPTTVDFRTLAAFKCTISNVNLSPYLKRY